MTPGSGGRRRRPVRASLAGKPLLAVVGKPLLAVVAESIPGSGWGNGVHGRRWFA
jgi:GTP:adenosylcobinamide-phosphate guanylyltransferase